MLKLFKVLDRSVKPAGKNHFFDKKVGKGSAKEFRDQLRAKGQKAAVIELGPDHDNHPLKRRKHGWNKGRHPKKSLKGKTLLNQRKS